MRHEQQTIIPSLSQRPSFRRLPAKRFQSNPEKRRGIYGDRIFGTTYDAHVVALDARTGKLLWDTTVADHKMGYEYTSGPIVVRGKVISGIKWLHSLTRRDCALSRRMTRQPEKSCGVRASIIACPGEPGGDTWGNPAAELFGLKWRAVDSGHHGIQKPI